jgi:hypothetical protein
MTDLMAMFDVLLRGAASCVACILLSATVDAADIRMDPSRSVAGGAVLEGKIEAGDFDKFKSFILNGNNVVEIYLASPGGDLAEALKIGLMIRILKLSTVVPSKALTNQSRELAAARHDLKDPKADYMCASACFFIFVAGIHRSSDVHGAAILGIHSPSLSKNSLNKLSFDQVAAADNRTRTSIEHYLKVMDVPAKYAEDMFSVPKGKLQWIRNDEFEADFAGFIPELRDRVEARCGNRTDVDNKNGQALKHNRRVEQSALEQSMRDMTTNAYEEQLNCERGVRDELALHAYCDALRRRNGEILQSIFDGSSPPLPK